MTKGEQSKQHLIECAAELFWRNGYHSTGLAAILKKAGLPKGSFYFYFKSKKELASAVIDYYELQVTEELRRFAEGADWNTFVDRMSDFMMESAERGTHCGCPFAVVGMDLAAGDEEVARKFFVALEKIRDLFAAVAVFSGMPEEEAAEFAELVYSVYEGRLLLYRIGGQDTRQIERMAREMKEIFRMKSGLNARVRTGTGALAVAEPVNAGYAAPAARAGAADPAEANATADIRLSEAIHGKALECGYDGCGIIPIGEMDGYKARIDERIEKIPSSRHVYGFYDMFTDLKGTFPWAKSVVVCTFWQGKYKYPESMQGRYGKAFMLSPDTAPDSPAHRKKLAFEDWMRTKGIRFAGGEENVPARILPLRHAAVAAGLGIFRQNNFFYGEKGSYYMLDGYLIDRECEFRNTNNLRPCSENCTICRDACGTKSLSAPYTMDPLKCVSFLTTFGGGAIPEGLDESALGTWICGCDACQDACPYNRHDWNQGEDFYGLDEIIELLEPENLIAASDEVLRDKVIPKTEFHISPKRINTLRACAERALRNAR